MYAIKNKFDVQENFMNGQKLYECQKKYDTITEQDCNQISNNMQKQINIRRSVTHEYQCFVTMAFLKNAMVP